MFQKRHYEAIAAVLKSVAASDATIVAFDLMFRADNPNFNGYRFSKAACSDTAAAGRVAAEAEAAMCVWEWWLTSDTGRKLDFAAFGGAAATRFLALDIGAHIERAYQAVASDPEAYDDMFDWDFVPGVMEVLAAKGLSASVSYEAVLAAAQRYVAEWQRALRPNPGDGQTGEKSARGE